MTVSRIFTSENRSDTSTVPSCAGGGGEGEGGYTLQLSALTHTVICDSLQFVIMVLMFECCTFPMGLEQLLGLFL